MNRNELTVESFSDGCWFLSKFSHLEKNMRNSFVVHKLNYLSLRFANEMLKSWTFQLNNSIFVFILASRNLLIILLVVLSYWVSDEAITSFGDSDDIYPKEHCRLLEIFEDGSSWIRSGKARHQVSSRTCKLPKMDSMTDKTNIKNLE